jgi:hypothetical protein
MAALELRDVNALQTAERIQSVRHILERYSIDEPLSAADKLSVRQCWRAAGNADVIREVARAYNIPVQTNGRQLRVEPLCDRMADARIPLLSLEEFKLIPNFVDRLPPRVYRAVGAASAAPSLPAAPLAPSVAAPRPVVDQAAVRAGPLIDLPSSLHSFLEAKEDKRSTAAAEGSQRMFQQLLERLDLQDATIRSLQTAAPSVAPAIASLSHPVASPPVALYSQSTAAVSPCASAVTPLATTQATTTTRRGPVDYTHKMTCYEYVSLEDFIADTSATRPHAEAIASFGDWARAMLKMLTQLAKIHPEKAADYAEYASWMVGCDMMGIRFPQILMYDRLLRTNRTGPNASFMPVDMALWLQCGNAELPGIEAPTPPARSQRPSSATATASDVRYCAEYHTSAEGSCVRGSRCIYSHSCPWCRAAHAARTCSLSRFSSDQPHSRRASSRARKPSGTDNKRRRRSGHNGDSKSSADGTE